MFTSNIRVGKNSDLSDFDHGMIVGDKQSLLNYRIAETGIFMYISLEFTQNG